MLHVVLTAAAFALAAPPATLPAGLEGLTRCTAQPIPDGAVQFDCGERVYRSSMAVIFWIQGLGTDTDSAASGLKVRRLRLMVGDLPGAYRALGRSTGTDSNGNAGWAAKPLGNQLISAGSFGAQGVSAPVDELVGVQPLTGSPESHVTDLSEVTPVGNIAQ